MHRSVEIQRSIQLSEEKIFRYNGHITREGIRYDYTVLTPVDLSQMADPDKITLHTKGFEETHFILRYKGKTIWLTKHERDYFLFMIVSLVLHMFEAKGKRAKNFSDKDLRMPTEEELRIWNHEKFGFHHPHHSYRGSDR